MSKKSKAVINMDLKNLSFDEMQEIFGKDSVMRTEVELEKPKLICPFCGRDDKLETPTKDLYDVGSLGGNLQTESYSIRCDHCGCIHQRHESEVE